jgi:hypothetical protein
MFRIFEPLRLKKLTAATKEGSLAGPLVVSITELLVGPIDDPEHCTLETDIPEATDQERVFCYRIRKVRKQFTRFQCAVLRSLRNSFLHRIFKKGIRQEINYHDWCVWLQLSISVERHGNFDSSFIDAKLNVRFNALSWYIPDPRARLLTTCGL